MNRCAVSAARLLVTPAPGGDQGNTGPAARTASVEHPDTVLPKAPSFVRPAIVGSAVAPQAADRARQPGDRLGAV